MTGMVLVGGGLFVGVGVASTGQYSFFDASPFGSNLPTP